MPNIKKTAEQALRRAKAAGAQASRQGGQLATHHEATLGVDSGPRSGFSAGFSCSEHTLNLRSEGNEHLRVCEIVRIDHTGIRCDLSTAGKRAVGSV